MLPSLTTTSLNCSTRWKLAWNCQPGQVWTQCHSYAFDFSVWEIWGALLHGGRLVVVPEAVAALTGRLPRPAGRRTGHACLTQTPSAVGDAVTAQGLESTALVIGAEACPAEVVDRWARGTGDGQRLRPDRDDDVCVQSARRSTPGSGAPPIGSPVSGAALFVLDEWLRPVPAGVVGELYVAGARRGGPGTYAGRA